MWSDMVCLGRPYDFKIFKGCLPQILPSPFLNTSCGHVTVTLETVSLRITMKNKSPVVFSLEIMQGS